MTGSDYPPIGLDDRLRFGKYKGRQLWEVLRDDPDYVAWMVGEDILLSDEAFEVYQKTQRR